MTISGKGFARRLVASAKPTISNESVLGKNSLLRGWRSETLKFGDFACRAFKELLALDALSAVECISKNQMWVVECNAATPS